MTAYTKYEQTPVLELPRSEYQPAHIHTPYDGKGYRRIFLDGSEVGAFYADTKLGFVRYYLHPLRANRRGTGARWAKKYGYIEVRKLSAWECLLRDWKRLIREMFRTLRFIVTGWSYDGNGCWHKDYA